MKSKCFKMLFLGAMFLFVSNDLAAQSRSYPVQMIVDTDGVSPLVSATIVIENGALNVVFEDNAAIGSRSEIIEDDIDGMRNVWISNEPPTWIVSGSPILEDRDLIIRRLGNRVRFE
jgi:hypothetical protein